MRTSTCQAVAVPKLLLLLVLWMIKACHWVASTLTRFWMRMCSGTSPPSLVVRWSCLHCCGASGFSAYGSAEYWYTHVPPCGSLLIGAPITRSLSVYPLSTCSPSYSSGAMTLSLALPFCANFLPSFMPWAPMPQVLQQWLSQPH